MRAALAAGGAALAATLSAGCGSGTGDADAPPEGSLTFSRHIAPIVFEHCAGCHRPGEVAPFSLLSYRDVRKRAKQIVRVTKSRYMPPWQPEPGRHAFVGDRSLGDVAIQTIARWVEEGAREGDPADLPPLPVFPRGWRLGEPDMVLEMTRPFELEAEGEDVFWNFVIPVPIDEPRHVRGVEFRPGNKSIIHHAEIRVDATDSSSELEKTPGTGFSGTVEGGNAVAPLGHFLGWTPGRTPFIAEEGGSWTLAPGSDLVLEVHLLPSGKPETLQARIGLFFTDEPPREQPYLLRLGRKNIDLPAGDAAVVMEDRYVLPVAVELRALQPHAHFLAVRIEAGYTLPDGGRHELIRIEDWDFGWQDYYRLPEPLALPAGSGLWMRYTYDNSADNPRNPHDPPRRVLYGPQSYDEMGDLWLQVVPRNAADLRRLRAERIARELAVDRERYEMELSIDPRRARAHYGLGNVLYRAGDLGAAALHYRDALRFDPQMSAAHNDLGTVLLRGGRTAPAERHYREALRLDPASRRARRNLANLLLAVQRFDEAQPLLEAVLRADPRDAEAHSNLGGLLFLRGDLEQARLHLETALRLRPGFSDARRNLERVRAAQRRS